MEQTDINKAVAELNAGADLMRQKDTELKGARLVSQLGQRLVDAGGTTLLKEVHALISPEHQRTVELQWYGLTDKEGHQWWP